MSDPILDHRGPPQYLWFAWFAEQGADGCLIYVMGVSPQSLEPYP